MWPLLRGTAPDPTSHAYDSLSPPHPSARMEAEPEHLKVSVFFVSDTLSLKRAAVAHYGARIIVTDVSPIHINKQQVRVQHARV